MVSAYAKSPRPSSRRPAPSGTWLSCRLDELAVKEASLRRALEDTSLTDARAAQLAGKLLILEVERLSIEGALKI